MRNSKNGGFKNLYNDSNECESIRYYDFPNEGFMSYSESDIMGLGEGIS
jgi:hypothetical protein